MKKSKALAIVMATAAALAAGGLPNVLVAQTTVSYSQTISMINTLNQEKAWTVSTTGPLLDMIIEGMAQNEGLYLSEGLKHRLVGSAIAGPIRIKDEVGAAENPADGELLNLLFYSKQAVANEATDVALRSAVGGIKGNGAAIKKSVEAFWKSKSITTNMIDCLEGYPPETAAGLVNVISMPWFAPANAIYENTDATWASQSLQQIYHDVREVELAKRSAVVKLLAQGGYISIPTSTQAVFLWSAGHYGYNKWPDITITLDPVTWSSSDVPALMRLAENPYYSGVAQAQLNAMGY